ncbi:unnamed protein product [Prorocentrum cordatum]|uniref:Selenoprotein O n=1 Tax=Prorocentrum cordatum TaxID=2364126 RepID=A0ABN9UN66_9DINO|nr:unnamed protein product [Polarella glacialis]
MGPDNMPVRAIYGMLAGPRQIVGRADQTVMLMTLRHRPWLSHIVSDLESLVNEGNAWDDSLASSSNEYADIWRATFAAARPCPPGFSRCPAHRDIQHVLDDQVAADFYGNALADFFANIGAREHVLPRAVHDAFAASLSDARLEGK